MVKNNSTAAGRLFGISGICLRLHMGMLHNSRLFSRSVV